MVKLDHSDSEYQNWLRFSWKINSMHKAGILPQYLYDDFVNMGFFSRLPSVGDGGRLAAMQERLMDRAQQYEPAWRESMIKDRILQIEIRMEVPALNVNMVIPAMSDQEGTS